MGKIGLSGVDTRALTRRIRDGRRAQRGDRARSQGRVRHSRAARRRAQWPGLEGMDLAKASSAASQHEAGKEAWELGRAMAGTSRRSRPHVVAIDYGSQATTSSATW
jgi:carbamoyl-phosphate synthase small subunit